MNMITNIHHTYSVNISDQVPGRKSKTWGKSSAEALPRASAGTEYFKKNGGGAPEDYSKGNYSLFII